jgi:hypothetical protein
MGYETVAHGAASRRDLQEWDGGDCINGSAWQDGTENGTVLA